MSPAQTLVTKYIKQQIRCAVWQRLHETGADRFPWAYGRIPNFVGADEAALTLSYQSAWIRARSVFINPDVAQYGVRRLALAAGKTVVMAVPKLAGVRPFVILRPWELQAWALADAAGIPGALRLGVPATAAELPVLDLMVVGCVAVDPDGARLGKGGGYSDTAYEWVTKRLIPGALIATTIHPDQMLPSGRIPMTDHDVPIDIVAEPRRCTYTHTSYPRPFCHLEALRAESAARICVTPKPKHEVGSVRLA